MKFMAGLYGNLGAGILGANLMVPVRPRVFVSYHHSGDQWYYNEFSRIFHDQHEAIIDRSLDRAKNSDNSDYVRWAIANQDIKGTSCTIVLCGAQTFQRKYVDWEIKATLDDRHGLIGVRLPTAQSNAQGQIIVPDRLSSNIHSGFALWINWVDLSVQNLQAWIATARDRPENLIVNPATIKQRNG